MVKMIKRGLAIFVGLMAATFLFTTTPASAVITQDQFSNQQAAASQSAFCSLADPNLCDQDQFGQQSLTRFQVAACAVGAANPEPCDQNQVAAQLKDLDQREEAVGTTSVDQDQTDNQFDTLGQTQTCSGAGVTTCDQDQAGLQQDTGDQIMIQG